MKTRILFLLVTLLTLAQGAWAQTDQETPLTMEARTAGTIRIFKPKSGMQYSVNGGAKTAVPTQGDEYYISVNVGDKVQFYGNGTSITSYLSTRIAYGTAECYIYGNIMSMVDEDNFATDTTLTGESAFDDLFSSANLYNHPTKKLVLPATTLTKGCYTGMFAHCEKLTVAPELPATTLAESCYANMFAFCTSLTTAPVLPAKTLPRGCYFWMFSGCTRLNNVTCYATDISALLATQSWLKNVADAGTFVKAEGMTGWSTGSSGIPEGWMVKEPSTKEVATETELRNALTNSFCIKLTADIELSNYLGIDNGNAVTLDLNGHTLSRNLSAHSDMGSVIRVEKGGTLTVKDSSGNNSGAISGGKTTNGGGITNHGKLTFEGGTITDCSATNGGAIFNAPNVQGGTPATMTMTGGVIDGCWATDCGGIYNYAGCTLTISGGEIKNCSSNGGGGGVVNYGTATINDGIFTGNHCVTRGGAVWNGESATLTITGGTFTGNRADLYGGGVFSYSSFNMGGKPVITGNMVNSNTENLYLADNSRINLTSAFAAGTSIGITTSNISSVLTSGYSTHNPDFDPASVFFYDIPGYAIALNSSGEVVVKLQEGRYITDVMVVGADDDDEAEAYYDYYTSQGWSGIWKDLNNNAGGHYIYLMYKTNTSPGSSGRAITDFYLHVSENYDAPNSLEYDGRTYVLAGYDGDATFKAERGDLNCEAGGYWIHLFYTKDRYWPLTYVTGISIDGNSENAVCENTRDTPCDLNKDAGGSDIFMHVSKYTETWDEHRSSEFSHVNGNTIYIENEGELALLAHNVTSNGNTYLGKTIVLNRDLDLSEYKWNPIGYWAGNVHQFHGEPNYDPGSWRDFRGDFDGKGHTIKGLYASGNDLPSGLFGYIVGETLDGFRTVRGCNYIKNLNIVDAYINGNSHVGGLAGYVYGEFKIENVVVQGSFTSRKYVGGIVGYGRAYHPNVEGIWLTMTIKDCVYLGPNLSGSYGSGAIYGYLEDTSETQQCKNYYANLGWPVNSNVWRLAAVRHKSLPEGIKLSLQANNCYWYDGVPYCKGGAEVSYTASSNTFYYDLTGTTLDGENKGLKHSFNVAEGTDYTIGVKCDATGITGNGSKADPYLLTTDKQWSQLLHMHSQGRSFNGLHFKLGADINISAAMPDSPAGFDGDGHTLTVNLKATGIYYGPLHSVRNATIKNLHVAGTLATDQLYSGGLVGRVYGNTSFTNCRSSVSILSSIAGSGNHGGFVGTVMDEDANVSIDGCRFDGKILTVGDAATNSCSGFVGEKRAGANLTISNSLYTPAELADGEVEAADFSATLARYTDGVAPSFVNAGYSRPLGAVQGVSGTDTKPEGMGDVTKTYDVSGITRYDAGVEHDGWWYKNVHAVEFADNAPNSSLISEAADQYSGQTVNATIQGRTFYADGNWNTICLPFDVTLESSSLAGAEARTLSSAALNNGTLTLNFSDPVETLTAGTPYIIKWVPTSSNTHLVIWTAKDWDAFAASVNDGKDYDRMTVELGADITVTSMVGTREHPFKGTFNGNGHTLTLNLTSNDQCCAPFRGIAGATIKNLHTTGTVTANDTYASGLVGMNNGASYISNCRNSVEIVSNYSSMNGGFVGASFNPITYTNCLFDGSITSRGSSIFACFTGTPYFDFGKYYNCLSKLKSATGNNIRLFPFGASSLSGIPITNSYYSDEFTYESTLGTPIGDMTNEQLAAALGDGWQVKDGEVIPVVKNTPTSGNVVNPVFYGAYITAAEPVDITPGLTAGTDGDGSITFKGIYDPMEIGDGGDNTKLYFSSNNTLYWPIGAMTFKPFRAYFQLNTTASVRAYKLNFGDETTGIVSMEDGRGQKEDVWYDLNGRKLDGKPTQKGVYIYKGKKVVIKREKLKIVIK